MREPIASVLCLECLVLANDHVVLYAESDARELVLWLVPHTIAGVFERTGEERSHLTASPIGMFVLRSTLMAPHPGLSRAISAQGVLWHRPAANEVDRRIAAYLAQEGHSPGSSPQSGS